MTFDEWLKYKHNTVLNNIVQTYRENQKRVKNIYDYFALDDLQRFDIDLNRAAYAEVMGRYLQECMIGEKGMNNEEYDRGFAQGKIEGAVEKRAEICKRLRFWADATRQVNPDIAIGYDHAISLIERDFAIESSDWIVADTEDDEYGFVAEYPMDLLNIRFLAGKENFKLDRTDEELDCLWRNFSDRYYSASWIGVDTDTVWRFCKWLKK